MSRKATEFQRKEMSRMFRRKVIYHLYKLPQVTIHNEKVLLQDGQILNIDGIKIECLLVPDPTAPYDAYEESDDTEEAARAGYLKGLGRLNDPHANVALTN